jgi:hypothetical protein
LAPNDGLFWALVVLAFILGVASTLVVTRLTRSRERRVRSPRSPSSAAAIDGSYGDFGPGRAASEADVPVTPEPASGASRTAHDLQARLLAVSAERVPVGCLALLICPPGGRFPMVWHVHLGAAAVLAVPDGRTIPLTPPPFTRDWQLPGGRVVRIADGGGEQQIGSDAVTVQVTGPYVRVTLLADDPGERTLTVTAFGDPRGPSELRADLRDANITEAALRQALDLAASSRLIGSPPVLGYSRAGWDAHTRIWLGAPGG